MRDIIHVLLTYLRDDAIAFPIGDEYRNRFTGELSMISSSDFEFVRVSVGNTTAVTFLHRQA
jgi:hypothetical protein